MEDEDIDPVILEKNIEYYLAAVQEVKPAWAKDGVCSGFAFLAFRSELCKQSKEYQKHLSDLASETKESLEEKARVLLEYRTLLERYQKKESFNQIRNLALKKISDKKLLKTSCEYYNFIHMLFAAFYPGRYIQLLDENKRHIKQEDFIEILKLLPVDSIMPEVSRVFNFAFNFTQKELVILFNRVLSTGDHVEITSTNHIVYLAVKKDCYVLYDPMPITIKRNNKSLAKLIKERFFTDEGIQSDYMPMSIHVFSENKEAIKPTQASLFKKLIEKRGKNKRLNQRAWDGATSLYIAAFDNCEPVVRMLASEGCDLNLSNKHLYTPIAIAAQCDNAEIIQLLVKHHADVNKTSQHKNTPLHLAAQYGHMKTIETLVAAKANILLKNKKDETPFLVAVRNHQWPTAAFFYKRLDEKSIAPDLRLLRKELKLSAFELESKLTQNPRRFFLK